MGSSYWGELMVLPVMPASHPKEKMDAGVLKMPDAQQMQKKTKAGAGT
jgi:hypothetical protein